MVLNAQKNASTKVRGSPNWRKAVLAQKKDMDKWKEKVQATNEIALLKAPSLEQNVDLRIFVQLERAHPVD